MNGKLHNTHWQGNTYRICHKWFASSKTRMDLQIPLLRLCKLL